MFSTSTVKHHPKDVNPGGMETPYSISQLANATKQNAMEIHAEVKCVCPIAQSTAVELVVSDDCSLFVHSLQNSSPSEVTGIRIRRFRDRS